VRALTDFSTFQFASRSFVAPIDALLLARQLRGDALLQRAEDASLSINECVGICLQLAAPDVNCIAMANLPRVLGRTLLAHCIRRGASLAHVQQLIDKLACDPSVRDSDDLSAFQCAPAPIADWLVARFPALRASTTTAAAAVSQVGSGWQRFDVVRRQFVALDPEIAAGFNARLREAIDDPAAVTVMAHNVFHLFDLATMTMLYMSTGGGATCDHIRRVGRVPEGVFAFALRWQSVDVTNNGSIDSWIDFSPAQSARLTTVANSDAMAPTSVGSLGTFDPLRGTLRTDNAELLVRWRVAIDDESAQSAHADLSNEQLAAKFSVLPSSVNKDKKGADGDVGGGGGGGGGGGHDDDDDDDDDDDNGGGSISVDPIVRGNASQDIDPNAAVVEDFCHGVVPGGAVLIDRLDSSMLRDLASLSLQVKAESNGDLCLYGTCVDRVRFNDLLEQLKKLAIDPPPPPKPAASPASASSSTAAPSASSSSSSSSTATPSASSSSSSSSSPPVSATPKENVPVTGRVSVHQKFDGVLIFVASTPAPAQVSAVVQGEAVGMIQVALTAPSAEALEAAKSAYGRINELHREVEQASNCVTHAIERFVDDMRLVLARVQVPGTMLVEWQLFRGCFISDVRVRLETIGRLFDDDIAKLIKSSSSGLAAAFADRAGWRDAVRAVATRHEEKVATIDRHAVRQTAFAAALQSMRNDASGAFAAAPSSHDRAFLSELDRLNSGLKAELSTRGAFDMDAMPRLLWRGGLLVKSCRLRLPVFLQAGQLVQTVRDKRVVSVQTSTGTGKSTLVPALLIGAGVASRVAVTQPRRLPCRQVCERVASVYGDDFCGYEVAGVAHNATASVVYLTDGLLRARLTRASASVNYDVVVLDELHERGAQSDLCLLLLAERVAAASSASFKLLLSSATLDDKVLRLFPGNVLGVFDIADMKSPFKIRDEPRPNEHPLAVVAEFAKRMKREDQILCFLPSTADVRNAVELSASHYGLHNVLGLTAGAELSAQSLRDTSIFFSTTIAETSLTFPSLAVVIDTGKIVMPQFDAAERVTRLVDVAAPGSTLTQRRGRLGRTLDGVYVALYDAASPRDPFAAPKLLGSDVARHAFAMHVGSGDANKLRALVARLPSANHAQLGGLLAASDELFGWLEQAAQPRRDLQRSVALKLVPALNEPRWQAALVAATERFKCGGDVLRLAVLLTTAGEHAGLLLQHALPSAWRAAAVGQGDCVALLRIFDGVLSEKNRSAGDFLARHGLATTNRAVARLLQRAARDFEQLEQSVLQLGSVQQRRLAERAPIAEVHERVCRALLVAWPDCVFGRRHLIGGRRDEYVRIDAESVSNASQAKLATATAPKLPSPFDDDSVREVRGIVNSSSVLYNQEPRLVLVLDALYSSRMPNLASLYVVSDVQAAWVDDSAPMVAQRVVPLSADEVAKVTTFQPANVTARMRGATALALRGAAGAVFEAEVELVSKVLDVTEKLNIGTEGQQYIARQHASAQARESAQGAWTESVASASSPALSVMFKPLKWRFLAANNVVVTLPNSAGEVTAKGRAMHVARWLAEMREWVLWASRSKVLLGPLAATRPVTPRQLELQQRNPSAAARDMRRRLAAIADAERSDAELLESALGASATRESRMEVLTWLALNRFHCKVSGGFLRDWVVPGRRTNPGGAPRSWLQFDAKTGVIDMASGLAPKDIDLHLPYDHDFDLAKFRNVLARFGITIDVAQRQPWRYVLACCVESGPFAVDLIEPHVAATLTDVDADVNALYAVGGQPSALGFKVNLEAPPLNLSVDDVVEDILKQRMTQVRHLEHGMQDRITKMRGRGWTVQTIDGPNDAAFVPNAGESAAATIVNVPRGDPVFVKLSAEFGAHGRTVVQVQRVSNFHLEERYRMQAVSVKLAIQQRTNSRAPVPDSELHEMMLFHGTKGAGIDGIARAGFMRELISGVWFGHGFYFAKDIRVSLNYVQAGSEACMYMCRVMLGRSQTLNGKQEPAPTKPAVGHHSIIGLDANKWPGYAEYVVFEPSQALPLYRIFFK
jgi:hypothetical protein